MPLSSAATGLFQLVISLIFTVLALYLGFAILKRITLEMTAELELARGNTAAGILVASVFTGIALVVQSGVSGITIGINKALVSGPLSPDGFVAIGTATLQLILGIILAVVSIWLALRILDRLTGSTPNFEEIKRGNVAVALEMAGMIITVAVIVQSGVIGITAAFG